MIDDRGRWAPDLSLKGYEALNDYHRFLMLSGPRKCVAGDTRVSTPNGLIRIRDLGRNQLFGDESIAEPVIAFDGKTTHVATSITSFDAGEKEGLQLTFANGFQLSVTTDHPIWCHFEENGSLRFDYLEAVQIQKRFLEGRETYFPFIKSDGFKQSLQSISVWKRKVSCHLCDQPQAVLGLCRKHWSNYRYHRRTPPGAFETLPLIIDEDTAYFLGAMCGDGTCKTRSIKSGRRQGINFTNADTECLEKFSKCLPKLGGTMIRVDPRKHDYRINCGRDSVIIQLLERLGMNCGSKSKRIPEVIYRSPLSVVSEFLKGLFDTDGYATHGGIGIGLTNEPLVQDIQTLLSMLGIFSYITKTKGTVKYGPNWKCSIYGRNAEVFLDKIGFTISRKVAAFVKKNRRSRATGYPDTIRAHLKRRIQSEKLDGKNRQWYRSVKSWREGVQRNVPNPAKLAKFEEVYGSDAIIANFRVAEHWQTIISIEPVVARFFDLEVEKFHSFMVSGIPMHNCSKTINAVNKICRHLWENDNAMCGIIGKSIRSIKSSGVWQDLVVLDTGIKQWLRADIGFDYTVEPKITGDTKMSFLRIRNMYGGVSECQVHSLEHDHEVEQKFKGTRYSMFYLPESDQFRSEMVLQVLDDQLRVPSISYDNHQILLDTNPAEEGPDHFLHRVFYRHEGEDGRPFTPARAAKYQVIEFTLDDNPFISDEEKQDLRDKYAHDPIKHARYVLGRWERDSAGGVFEDVWSEPRHVIGQTLGRPDDWEIIIPGPNSHEFVVGWDCGDVNHSVSILCPREGDTATTFDLIDELVIVDRQVSLADFTEGVMERMDFWEAAMKAQYQKEHKIIWRHWSDPSAADRYRSGADSYDAKIIRNASDGRIVLNFAQRAQGSVRRRKDLLRRVLHQGRVAVSAQCRAHIDMFRYLKPGSSAAEPIQRASAHKHAFDSLTYALSNEVPAELDRRNQATVVRRPKIISVG